MSAAVLGTARASRHSLILPRAPDGTLEPLSLDLTIAPAPGGHESVDCIVLYVLDPEPVLFGAACLHCYAGAGYYARVPTTSAEGGFRCTHVVGIGHSVGSSFAADAVSWDGPALRNLRRRDFPPCNHPTVDPSRQPNACSRRLAGELAATVFPHVEAKLLGLDGRPATRALLGSSYSAVLALQTMLHAPGAVDAFILGSPSMPFDPELVDWLRDAPLSAAKPAVFIAYGALEREPPPAPQEPQQAVPGTPFTADRRNVHRDIPDASHALADLLRSRGAQALECVEVAGEDHTSLKLALISRGLSWLLGWWAARRVASADGDGGERCNDVVPAKRRRSGDSSTG